MIENEVFVHLKLPHGTLYVEHILFDAQYPQLFVCTNLFDQRFLCVCHTDNEYGKQYLIVRVTGQTIADLLTNRITLRDAFTKAALDKISVSVKGDTVSIIYRSEGWGEDEQNLPDDETLDLSDDEIKEYGFDRIPNKLKQD